MPLTDDVHVPRRLNAREVAKQQTRGVILEAAADRFVQQGYNATSLREVAAQAGLSHTGLLHHFPDKVALLEAVLDDRFTGAADVLPLESHDGETFIRALIELAGLDMVDSRNISLFTILSAEALAVTHPAHGYFIRWQHQVRTRMESALLDLQRRGLYRSNVPPRLAAQHLAAMRDGINLQWLLAPTAIDLADAVRSQLLLYVDLDL